VGDNRQTEKGVFPKDSGWKKVFSAIWRRRSNPALLGIKVGTHDQKKETRHPGGNTTPRKEDFSSPLAKASLTRKLVQEALPHRKSKIKEKRCTK